MLKLEIYIQPHPIIRRMNFSETMDALNNVHHWTKAANFSWRQSPIKPPRSRKWSDERSLLHPCTQSRTSGRGFASRYIKTGVVKFPRHGCEQLLTQLLGFGGENHDDAVDALVYLILGLVEEGITPQDVHYI